MQGVPLRVANVPLIEGHLRRPLQLELDVRRPILQLLAGFRRLCWLVATMMMLFLLVHLLHAPSSLTTQLRRKPPWQTHTILGFPRCRPLSWILMRRAANIYLLRLVLRAQVCLRYEVESFNLRLFKGCVHFPVVRFICIFFFDITFFTGSLSIYLSIYRSIDLFFFLCFLSLVF